ncbi:hypothetical protein VCV18_006025 [Metarhizium anisopliae]
MSQQSTLLDKAVDKAAGNRQNGRSARAYNLSSTTLSRTLRSSCVLVMDTKEVDNVVASGSCVAALNRDI